MREVRFTIPGRPIPAARMTRKGMWVVKQAQKYLAYRQQVHDTALEFRLRHAADVLPFTGPVGVEMHLFIRRGTRGDGDNYFKAILDGCNEVVFHDDRQIVEGHFYIHLVDDTEHQRAEVRFWEIDGGEEGAAAD